MSSRPVAPITTTRTAVVFLALLLPAPTLLHAQLFAPNPQFRVQGPTQQLEMVVNTSRILTLEKEVPKVMVNDPQMVRVTPLGASQIQVAAQRPGVTQINIWDVDGDVYAVDVIVYNDARELEMLLRNEFPTCSLRVRPLASSVVISGYVDQPETVHRVIKMAEDYYPKVISNITVGGVQTVLLHVKMMEVSRTKLRELGFDWANLNGDDSVIQSVSGLITAIDPISQQISASGDTLRFGITNGANQFFGFLEALRQNNMVKVMANPTLTTVSGRPASFKVGGEFPILVPGGLGTIAVEFKPFGTRVDFVPIVLGNGNLRLEVRPQVSEIDESRSVTINNITVPGLRDRWVDTAVEMKPGQTLAVAGLVQERVEAENKGLPWLADLPFAGAAFRRVEEKVNEIELLVLVTPELVDALDPHEMPPCLPGMRTTSPNDVELYLRGYMEVPRCCPPGAPCAHVTPGGVLPGDLYPQHAPLPGMPEGSASESFETVPVPSAPSVIPDNAAPSARRYPSGMNSRMTTNGLVPLHTVAAPTSPPAARQTVSNPHVSTNRQNRSQATSSISSAGDPGLIGPFGYDDLN